jgi:hypothetical protein
MSTAVANCIDSASGAAECDFMPGDGNALDFVFLQFAAEQGWVPAVLKAPFCLKIRLVLPR